MDPQPAPAALPTEPNAPAPRLLAPAPVALVSGGLPLAGSWSGTVADASLATLGAPYAQGLWRKLVEKRWVYTLIAAPDVFVCLAVVDTGYLHTGFLGVFDRKARALLADVHPVLPPLFARVADDPGLRMSARLSGPGLRAEIVRGGQTVRVSADWSGGSIELVLDQAGALPPLSVCALLSAGRFDFTQKSVLLRASGEVRCGDQAFPVDSAPAGLDFTHGLLERDTAWRWAYGLGTTSAGRRVAFNFSEGFLGEGGPENAVWVDGAPALAGPVAFSFDPKDLAAPWSVRSPGGGVELEFTPEGQRAQDVNLGLLVSRYAQPFGSFRGHLTSASGERIPIDGIAGVTEDHVARW